MQIIASVAVLAAAFVAQSNAAASILLYNYNVTAGVNTSAVITAEYQSSSYVTPEFTGYNISLYSDMVYGYLCDLPQVTNNTNIFNLVIPPSVGPSGGYYRLVVRTSGTTVRTLPIFLSSATGQWSSYEVAGYGALPGIGSGYSSSSSSSSSTSDFGSGVPCGSYDCVRQCLIAYPLVSTSSSYSSSYSYYGSYDSRYITCVQQCPGVNLKFSSSSNSYYESTSTTTLTGSAATRTSSPIPLTAPTVACDVNKYQTPCSKACCAAGSYCSSWGYCSSSLYGSSAFPTTSVSNGSPLPTSNAGSGSGNGGGGGNGGGSGSGTGTGTGTGTGDGVSNPAPSGCDDPMDPFGSCKVGQKLTSAATTSSLQIGSFSMLCYALGLSAVFNWVGN